MKQNLIYSLIVAVCLFTACKKQGVENVFDKLPEERMAERNQELRTKLTENIHGWKAFLRTSANGGGYGFFMKFNQDETVTMYSDWDDNSAVQGVNSTYSIRFIMNTSLIFDTYNYITIMQDPQKSANGGTQPNGLQSDIEFEYLRSSADTVILRGKKYQNYLYLLKATASESSSYGNGGFLSTINQFKDYFITHSNNYISLDYAGASIKMGILFDYNLKTVEVQGKLAEGKFGSNKQGFGFSIDGGFFINPIEFADNKFIAIKFKNANSLVLIDDKGKEYPIVQNPVPLTELREIFGSGSNKTYNSIYLVDGKRPSGVTSAFNSVYDGVISRFQGTSRTVDTLEIRLSNSNTALVRLWYLSGTSRFLADASFNYTLSADGTLTFSNYIPAASNANWTTRITQIGNLVDWLQSGPFKIDWVASTEAGAPNYGGLYRIADPESFYYGYLRKF
jgi:hypothetical protein